MSDGSEQSAAERRELLKHTKWPNLAIALHEARCAGKPYPFRVVGLNYMVLGTLPDMPDLSVEAWHAALARDTEAFIKGGSK